MIDDTAGTEYLRDLAERFRSLKQLADRALGQVTDEQFFAEPGSESNSLAVLVRHMGGNLRSRWTDFLTTDGEKPDRDREGEFVIPPGTSRREIVASWDDGWSCVFTTVDALRPADLVGTVRVRSQPHSVIEAMQRQLAHAAYHVGQIVYLAKHYRSSSWENLSIPRGGTEEVNRRMREIYGAAGPEGAPPGTVRRRRRASPR